MTGVTFRRLTAKLLVCGLLAASTVQTARALDKIKFGMLRSQGQVFVGIDKGFFARNGIEVELVYFRSGAELVPSLSRGQIDIAATTPGAALFNALEAGSGLRIVADYLVHVPGTATHAVMVRKDLAGRVHSAADVKGMTVAITARGQYTDLAAGEFLKTGGLTTKDVRLVNMPYPDMVAAFRGKSIDVAMLAEPFITNVIEQNLAVRLVNHADYMPNLDLGVVMYGERLEGKDRDLGVRFMRGFIEAMKFTLAAHKDPALRKEYAQIMQKYLPLPNPEMHERVALPGARPDPTVDRAQLGWQLRYYQEEGLVPKPPKIDAIVDDGFVKQATAHP